MIRDKFLFHVFNLLYTRLAWAYDLVAWIVSAGQWYRWVEAALSFIEAGPVLEVGCGRGRLLQPIAELGYSVVGVDWTMQMARHAGRISQQPVLRADGRTLPFPDAYFGTLITTFPAPYILERQTQREFARVIRPGGLWLWVDAPAFEPVVMTALARFITQAAYSVQEQSYPFFLAAERNGGLWLVHMERVVIGQTTVAVRVARRQGAWEELTT